MAQTKSYRDGWQCQNIARAILHDFCFLSEPLYSANDIGGDFFCTIFEREQVKTTINLLPRQSFWIQVKSEKQWKKDNDLTKILPTLNELKMPFFIGSVNLTTLSLKIYSGHYLTPLFAYKGFDHIHELSAKECDNLVVTPDDYYFEDLSGGKYALYFPFVDELRLPAEISALDSTTKLMLKECTRMLENIATGINEEHTFRTHSDIGELMFAGSGSIKVFERNFFKRFAEVFFNLNKACENPENMPLLGEMFPVYNEIFLQLDELYGARIDNLSSLRRQYAAAKRQFESKKASPNNP